MKFTQSKSRPADRRIQFFTDYGRFKLTLINWLTDAWDEPLSSFYRTHNSTIAVAIFGAFDNALVGEIQDQGSCKMLTSGDWRVYIVLIEEGENEQAKESGVEILLRTFLGYLMDIWTLDNMFEVEKHFILDISTRYAPWSTVWIITSSPSHWSESNPLSAINV